ncbi:S1 RNA-binding protein [Phocicoccus schoeneichii]|uniref:30S ribosomal protein S1 n=1 Tax=Phocicoccus schoeneichii TaxID=1812261 RepID=A0A6V7R554_9BACL|nr:Tex family protein [Jeotgalicoccus schoeneichii]GGH53508.1 S1 RNA-binding protein [Jeotgalicoccus schoeneichii]CAD2072148.1 30S ribosomal protein S1 [Jeotgalicoccus schoeneichii]
MNEQLIKNLSTELKIKPEYISNVLSMLADKSTVPFIARYRKEQTGGLDETEIKAIEDEYRYLENLEKRKEEVMRLIDEQGMLTNDLKQDILKQTELARVEDLYRPFRQKRKTRATEAVRKGLKPLFEVMLKQDVSEGDLETEAESYITEEVTSVEDALNGANDIYAEHISDDAQYRKVILREIKNSSLIVSSKKKNAEDEQNVFEMYYDYSEAVKRIPPHRTLAMNRGEKLNVLTLKFEHNIDRISGYLSSKVIKENSKISYRLNMVIEDSLKRLILPSLEREVRNDMTEVGEAHAVNIFEENLKSLLLQPPLKNHMILGVDPAFRTGCKLAVINPSGTFVDKNVIYPHMPVNKKKQAEKIMLDIIKKHNITLVAIGNGTASRETEEFISELIKNNNLDLPFIIVNEAGASVYSASEVAREEFPDFQVEERSAVSIARRVQDPLSELVKIDPKSIGVGQYQHDVNQKNLSEALDFVVETVVNQVGVDVNTASYTLLEHVAGLSPQISKNIVAFREENKGINKRSDLKKVPRLGPKTFEQCVGFLRIIDGKEPLDQTEIHPEQYKNTYKLLDTIGASIKDLGTDEIKEKLEKLDQGAFAEKEGIGLPTLEDMVKSLIAPLRDIRDQYDTPLLKSDVLEMKDLKSGMKLSGTVRNVTDFGAFVDVGVGQDGLVHISQLSNRFVKHPLDVVSSGDIVEVTVMDVDVHKKRISLTMKAEKK